MNENQIDPEIIVDAAEPNITAQSNFRWPKYLNGIGIAILLLGIITALILAFFIIFVDYRFNLSGLIVVISLIIGSMIFHAIFSWMARILGVIEEIRDNLLLKWESEESDKK